MLIESQSGYCRVIGMFCGINLNGYERTLRIVYNDYESSFQESLGLDNLNSVSIYHRNIRFLTIELFKVKNGLSNQIMSELFDLQNI